MDLLLLFFLTCSLDCREEELQLQKRKKRKVKGNSRLSFADDIENGSEEEDGKNSKHISLAWI